MDFNIKYLSRSSTSPTFLIGRKYNWGRIIIIAHSNIKSFTQIKTKRTVPEGSNIVAKCSGTQVARSRQHYLNCIGAKPAWRSCVLERPTSFMRSPRVHFTTDDAAGTCKH